MQQRPLFDRGPWIQTFTGRQFHYDDPQPDDIHIEDIAQALSNLCRFAGHTSRFYSVAEHSLLVSRQFAHPELRMIGLLHDATEAYVIDMPRPLKNLLPDYKRYEAQLWAVIAEKFRLPQEIPAEVHEADTRMLITERPFLFRHPIPWAAYADVQPIAHTRIQCSPPQLARADFLDEFLEIQRKR